MGREKQIEGRCELCDVTDAVQYLPQAADLGEVSSCTKCYQVFYYWLKKSERTFDTSEDLLEFVKTKVRKNLARRIARKRTAEEAGDGTQGGPKRKKKRVTKKKRTTKKKANKETETGDSQRILDPNATCLALRPGMTRGAYATTLRQFMDFMYFQQSEGDEDVRDMRSFPIDNFLTRQQALNLIRADPQNDSSFDDILSDTILAGFEGDLLTLDIADIVGDLQDGGDGPLEGVAEGVAYENFAALESTLGLFKAFYGRICKAIVDEIRERYKKYQPTDENPDAPYYLIKMMAQHQVRHYLTEVETEGPAGVRMEPFYNQMVEKLNAHFDDYEFPPYDPVRLGLASIAM